MTAGSFRRSRNTSNGIDQTIELIIVIVPAAAAGIFVSLLSLAVIYRANEWRSVVFAEARLVSAPGERSLALPRFITSRLTGSRPFLILVKQLEEAGFRLVHILALRLIVALAAFMSAALIVTRSPIKVTGLLILVVSAFHIWTKKMAGARREQFEAQLPLIVHALAGAITSGQSLNQAIVRVAQEVPDPGGSELGLVSQQISLGMTLDAALEELRCRWEIEALNMAVAGLAIQKRTGGNMAQLLRQVSEALAERRRLQEDLRVETTQSRMSASLIGVLPVIVLGAISVVDPTFIAPLLSTPGGLVMLALAAALEAAGFFLISRILDIEP